MSNEGSHIDDFFYCDYEANCLPRCSSRNSVSSSRRQEGSEDNAEDEENDERAPDIDDPGGIIVGNYIIYSRDSAMGELSYEVIYIDYHIKSIDQRDLILSGNNFEAVPQFLDGNISKFSYVYHLSRYNFVISDIVVLNLSDNALTEFLSPSILLKLTSMKKLYLQNNRIASIPRECIEAIAQPLVKFDIRENLLGFPIQEMMDMMDDDTSQFPFIANFIENSEVSNSTLKIVLVGERGAGKSLLRKSIVDKLSPNASDSFGGADAFEDADSEFGIYINRCFVHSDNGKKIITLNIWDFAGHRAYHAAHEMFFSANSLYLVVWNVGDMDYDHVFFWVDIITTSIPEASIMVVATHADMLSESESQELTRKLNELQSLVQKRKKSNIIGYFHSGYDVIDEKDCYASTEITDTLRSLLFPDPLASHEVILGAFKDEVKGSRFLVLHFINELRDKYDCQFVKVGELLSYINMWDDSSRKDHEKYTIEIVKDALSFLHLCGEVIYLSILGESDSTSVIVEDIAIDAEAARRLESDNLIILDPKWLVEVLKVVLDKEESPQSIQALIR